MVSGEETDAVLDWLRAVRRPLASGTGAAMAVPPAFGKPMDVPFDALIRNMALECYRQWVRAGKVVPMEEAAQILGSMTLHSVEHLMSPRPESD